MSFELPPIPDLQSSDHLYLIRRRADAILEEHSSSSSLAELELQFLGLEHSLSEQLAVKLALSRAIILEKEEPMFLSIVFAVYKETERMMRPEEHPHGEDLLIRKIEQMNWLTRGSSANWELVVVDDGCPDGSGDKARSILSERGGAGLNYRVLFIKDAIADKFPVVAGLNSPDDSRKGGSILYGMWEATREPRSNHIVIFTDADLSTHLGQCGLLVDPIINGAAGSCIGSRRMPESVVLKGGKRNARGKLFIYLWKQMIPELEEIIDTQCGFKAFRADLVQELVEDLIEKKFAFDIELLICLRKQQEEEIVQRGIAWIDSEAASTTRDLQPYLPMLTSIAAMNRKYLSGSGSRDIVELIESMEEDNWNTLLDSIPPAIEQAEMKEIATKMLVSTSDLRELSGL